MRPGIKVLNETMGTGLELVKGKTAIINLRMFLPDGQELEHVRQYGQKMTINLARRDAIAGIRYGIEGMRVGGHREFIISSHLAYGSKGIPDQVPPNSLLRCEVDLLEIRDTAEPKPEDYPPGKQLTIIHPGERSRSMAKWQFGLLEDGSYGASVTVPIPGLKWRHARPKSVQGKLDAVRTVHLLAWTLQFPSRYPEECVSSPYNEGGDSAWYLDAQKKTVCISIQILEQGKHLGDYFVSETSETWSNSELNGFVKKTIEPLLVPEIRPAN